MKRRGYYGPWCNLQDNALRHALVASLKAARLSHLEFARYVEDVLRTPKVITDSIGWEDKLHPHYVTCKLPVYAPDMPHFRLRLILQCHVRKKPMRCSFTLIFTQRIFGLDVNPGLTHTNRIGGGRTVIRGTHWTRWPCDVAEPDPRNLEHQQWFNHYLQAANIAFLGRYDYPPYLPEQIELPL